MTARVLIMAGGTGGHIYPALAVADELKSRGVEVSWLGTRRGLEADVVVKAGYPIDWISISGLRGKALTGWLAAPFKLLLALLQSGHVMLKRKPSVVLGMGGFVTGPGGVMAWVLGKPLLLHEQNSIPGMTNRLLSHLARKIMVAFPDAFRNNKKTLNTGNPLRQSFLSLASPERRLAERKGRLRVLVVGGSLGAVTLNKIVPQALARFDAEARPEVIHQSGRRNIEQTRGYYQQAGVEADIRAYLENMSDAYGWADLVICRAGALTIAELAAVGAGSILVPYPHAVDDHQTSNARFLQQAGAAMLMPQPLFTADALYDALRKFCEDRASVMGMAVAARRLGRPEATHKVADLCLEMANV